MEQGVGTGIRSGEINKCPVQMACFKPSHIFPLPLLISSFDFYMVGLRNLLVVCVSSMCVASMEHYI